MCRRDRPRGRRAWKPIVFVEHRRALATTIELYLTSKAGDQAPGAQRRPASQLH
jgi:hypothetical protein